MRRRPARAPLRGARAGSSPFRTRRPRRLDLIVGQLSQALFLAWPAALVASARVSFDVSGASPRRSFFLIGVVWAAASTALALTYPITRGPVLARCYLAVELVALLVTAVTICRWVRERRTPELHHLSIALVATAELCTLVGPWRYDLFGSWPLAQSVYLTLFGVLVVLQGIVMVVAWVVAVTLLAFGALLVGTMVVLLRASDKRAVVRERAILTALEEIRGSIEQIGGGCARATRGFDACSGRGGHRRRGGAARCRDDRSTQHGGRQDQRERWDRCLASGAGAGVGDGRARVGGRGENPRKVRERSKEPQRIGPDASFRCGLNVSRLGMRVAGCDAQNAAPSSTSPATPTWYADTRRSKKLASSCTSWSSMKSSGFFAP